MRMKTRVPMPNETEFCMIAILVSIYLYSLIRYKNNQEFLGAFAALCYCFHNYMHCTSQHICARFTEKSHTASAISVMRINEYGIFLLDFMKTAMSHFVPYHFVRKKTHKHFVQPTIRMNGVYTFFASTRRL